MGLFLGKRVQLNTDTTHLKNWEVIEVNGRSVNLFNHMSGEYKRVNISAIRDDSR